MLLLGGHRMKYRAPRTHLSWLGALIIAASIGGATAGISIIEFTRWMLY
jgi:hypothetical protein